MLEDQCCEEEGKQRLRPGPAPLNGKHHFRSFSRLELFVQPVERGIGLDRQLFAIPERIGDEHLVREGID